MTTTATTTTGATTTTAGVMTIAVVISTVGTTTTIALMITIGTMIIVVTIIATTITPTDGTQEITKEPTGRNTYTRSDGVHPTTTVDGHARHGPNHHVPKSNKNDNWYR
mgnify:CR=1 FL=1